MSLKVTSPIILVAFFAVPAFAQSEPTSGRTALLIHGNYCGPGNNAPLAPIDALDAACARHDACTPFDGLPSKACNLRLQVDAERVANDSRQPNDLRIMAGLVASGAAMMPAKPLGSYEAAAVPLTMTVVHRPGALHRLRHGAQGADAE